jgi:hypothetical protein
MIMMYADARTGRLCPVIVCSACNEWITNAERAAVVFTGPAERPHDGLEFRHNTWRTGSGCNPPGRPWRPLTEFLGQLMRNVESDLRTADDPGGR